MLQEEKRHSDNLMSKILTADKPRYGKAPASGKRSLKDAAPPEGITAEPSGASTGRQPGSMIPTVRQKPRCDSTEAPRKNYRSNRLPSRKCTPLTTASVPPAVSPPMRLIASRAHSRWTNVVRREAERVSFCA